MLKEFEAILDRAEGGDSADRLATDVRLAALYLLDHQFLYDEDHFSRPKVALILEHEGYFAALLDALGLRLVKDAKEGFVGYVPLDGATARSLRLDETLFLVALRILFEEGVEAAAVKEGGRVEVRLSQVWDLVAERVRRAAPPIGRAREIVRAFQRQGLVKLLEDLSRGDAVLDIRPAIRMACLEKTLEDLERFASAGSQREGDGESGTEAADAAA